MLSSFNTISLGKLPNSFLDPMILNMFVSQYPSLLQYNLDLSSSDSFDSFINITLTTAILSVETILSFTSCSAYLRFCSPDSEYSPSRYGARSTRGDSNPCATLDTNFRNSAESKISSANPEVFMVNMFPFDSVGINTPLLRHSI